MLNRRTVTSSRSPSAVSSASSYSSVTKAAMKSDINKVEGYLYDLTLHEHMAARFNGGYVRRTNPNFNENFVIKPDADPVYHTKPRYTFIKRVVLLVQVPHHVC